jgi:tRNA(adenine34) deaminase
MTAVFNHFFDNDAGHLMGLALREAERAARHGDVPVGAVIARGGEVLAAAGNERELRRDPTAHAEIIAIRAAAEKLGGWRLTGCTIYVTIEPCPMCAGAIYMSRIERLVYGAVDEKAGAAGTLMDIVRDPRLNHQVQVDSGLLATEAASLLKQFFASRR